MPGLESERAQQIRPLLLLHQLFARGDDLGREEQPGKRALRRSLPEEIHRPLTGELHASDRFAFPQLRGELVGEHVVLLRPLLRDERLHRFAQKRPVALIRCLHQAQEKIRPRHASPLRTCSGPLT